mmetsp:Transcript_17331/g.42018  ORF Transcript_17331/g.42018 Transcript_17331/m.42018 type:complete len:302 (+) Transcript_17331:725-1630(+)
MFESPSLLAVPWWLVALEHDERHLLIHVGRRGGGGGGGSVGSGSEASKELSVHQLPLRLVLEQLLHARALVGVALGHALHEVGRALRAVREEGADALEPDALTSHGAREPKLVPLALISLPLRLVAILERVERDWFEQQHVDEHANQRVHVHFARVCSFQSRHMNFRSNVEQRALPIFRVLVRHEVRNSQVGDFDRQDAGLVSDEKDVPWLQIPMDVFQFLVEKVESFKQLAREPQGGLLVERPFLQPTSGVEEILQATCIRQFHNQDELRILNNLSVLLPLSCMSRQPKVGDNARVVVFR